MTEQFSGEQPYREWLVGGCGRQQLHTLPASGPQASQPACPASDFLLVKGKEGWKAVSTSAEFVLKGPEVGADAKKKRGGHLQSSRGDSLPFSQHEVF